MSQDALASPSPLPLYDSASTRSPALAELGQLVRYRDLLRLLIAGIVKTRYKRSVLGVTWTLLNPLLNMAVMTVAFSALFRSTVTNYAVYVLTGLLWWNFFTQTTTYAMSSLVWGGGLLKRVYIPRTLFAVSSVGHGLINLGLNLVPLAAIMFFVDHPFHATWLFLPVSALLLAVFSLGVALFVSTLAVFFVDVVDLYSLGLQALFFLTPIIYPHHIVPEQWRWLVRLNPIVYLLDTFRRPLLYGVLPEPHVLLAATACALAMLVLGWWTFTRKADEFAYRV
jgi:ABC-type polysaccharide/polyol phosphate export permease